MWNTGFVVADRVTPGILTRAEGYVRRVETLPRAIEDSGNGFDHFPPAPGTVEELSCPSISAC
jgi:hypothetical protein